MPSRLYWILGAALAVAVTACASTSVPSVNPSPTEGNTSTPATTPVVGTPAVATTGVSRSSVSRAVLTPRRSVTAAVVSTPTIVTTPTVYLSPTPSPTLGPPTPTLTPAPDEATSAAAAQLDTALVAFANAESQGGTAASLQAQRALLDAATKAAAVANADQSQYGQQLRSALGDVQGAATGNYDQMQAAHNLLVQLGGALVTPEAALPRPANQTQQSLPDVTRNLKSAVDEYVQASATGNADDLLKAQRDLITATAAADAATKNNTSPQAQQLSTALTALHDALGGDASKFASAQTDLAAAQNQAAETPTPSPTISPTTSPTSSATITPTGTPTTSPTATATATPTLAAGQSQVDLQPLQNKLDNNLQTLQSAVGASDKSGITAAETNLQQSIQQASDALANVHTQQADQFRAALTTATNAANGDPSKIQAARDQLKAALGQ